MVKPAAAGVQRASFDAVATTYRATRREAASSSTLRLRWTARRMARDVGRDPTDLLALARKAAVRDERAARGFQAPVL
jgi:hypothetical protein